MRRLAYLAAKLFSRFRSSENERRTGQYRRGESKAGLVTGDEVEEYRESVRLLTDRANRNLVRLVPKVHTKLVMPASVSEETR